MMPDEFHSLVYFRPEEFRCKCCGEVHMQANFLARLDTLRAKLGYPLPVTSGYRCPKHNCEVSTTGGTGPHTTGRAADIAVSRHRAYDLIGAGIDLGFTGIGVQQKGAVRFIHLDDLTEPDHAPRPSVWSY